MGQKAERLETLGRIGVGLTALYLTTNAFASKTRKKVSDRDDNGTCQVEGCNDRNASVHHIAPECLKNTLDGCSTTQLTDNDSYSDYFVKYIQRVMETIPEMNKKDVNKCMCQKLKDMDNAITLCVSQHRALHRGRIDGEELQLKRNEEHETRPNNLGRGEVRRFISDFIIRSSIEEVDAEENIIY